MENPFCIAKEDLRQLLMKKHRERLNAQMAKFRLTLTEMLAQMESDRGVFAEAMIADTNAFAKKTENVEIFVAFDLADFYFPNANPLICFEVKNRFPNGAVVSYDTLLANIESNTHIDCLIKDDVREFAFQIKRYPQEYRVHSREALSGFIVETARKYANMKGTILIVVLQPNTEESTDLSFKGIHDDIIAMQEKITFDEIDLVFNDGGQKMRWQQVFPQFGHCTKPLTLLSDKYQAKQAEWAKKKI